jgi:ubiquinone/menaquinone biosynthesis C-methylase UbiE
MPKASHTPPNPATAKGEDIARLESMTTWPYPVEPPRKSVIVNACMKATKKARSQALVTPHLHGGDAIAKLEYERRTGDYFWTMLEPVVTPDVLDGKKVLDVGCGYGGKSVYMAENTGLSEITGFDLPEVFDPEVAARYAHEQGLSQVSFTTGHGEDIPFGDDEFDAVVVDDVLEHVQNPERTMKECRRVLKPGGLAIIKFPSIKMMMSHHFDRALKYPALHWIRPMRVWAAGFNHYLLYGDNSVHYDPFAKVVATPYHDGVTSNLNGLDLDSFRRIVQEARFRTRALELLRPMRASKSGPLLRLPYEALRSLPFLRERLSDSIAFVGEK